MPSDRVLISAVRRYTFAGMVGLGLLGPASAVAESLDDALVAAYGGNPTLLAERAQLRSTDENVSQALANWRPVVSFSASKGDSTVRSRDGFGAVAPGSAQAGTLFSTSSSYSTRPADLGLTVTEDVWRGGRTDAQTRQAENQVLAERANLVATEQSVFLTVVTDYTNVVEAQAALDANLNNEQVLRRQLESTNAQFRVGEVTRTDVSQAEASYAQAIANRQSAEGTLEINRAAYEHDVGQPPGKLAAPETAPPLPATRDEALATAKDAAPTVLEARYNVEAADAQIRLIRGELLPTVSVQGALQRSAEQESIHDRTDSGSVTAQVSVPLYEQGSVYSRSRAAQQQADAKRRQLDDAVRAAIQAASQAWDHLQATRATLVSLRAQVRANEIALEGVRKEREVGSRTILDVLNQEQTLFQSRVSLIQSQRDEIVYEYTLLQAIGRLTARDLDLKVTLYDPLRNYNTVRDKWWGFGTAEEPAR